MIVRIASANGGSESDETHFLRKQHLASKYFPFRISVRKRVCGAATAIFCDLSKARTGLAVLIFCILGLSTQSHTAMAQSRGSRNPFLGAEQFPEFRDFSALSGSTYGVDASGYVSLSGPTALSTPIAHVLGHGQFRLGGGFTSFNSSPAFRDHNSDGTFFGTYGQTVGRFNAAVSLMVLSIARNLSMNGQIQYVPAASSQWAASIGIQDWRGAGGSAGEAIAGDGRKSRSPFGVLTYRVDMLRSPVYLSAGVGLRRFQGGFGSVSYQVSQPVRVWMEHDGFGINSGVLLSWKTDRSTRSPEVNALIGLVKNRYLTLGGGMGF